MKRRAFTLMELLLVVAILAILAAAAAPTFTSGSADAIEEARKSNFLAAYENTVSGANLMMAMLLTHYTKSKSWRANENEKTFLVNKSLDDGNAFRTELRRNENDVYDDTYQHNLNHYIPVGSRVFYTKKGKQYFISARFDANQNLKFYYVKVENAQGLKQYHSDAHNQKDSGHDIVLSKDKTLDDYWKELRDK